MSDHDMPELPHDDAAERYVLGAAMLDPAVIDALHLAPADFYTPRHGRIWEAITALHAAGAPGDPVAVAAKLTAAGALPRVGGAPYLHTLMSSAGATSSTTWYADQVRAHAHARRVIAAGARITQIGTQPDLTAAERTALTQEIAGELDTPGGGAGPRGWIDLIGETMIELEEAADRGPGLRGLPTGLLDLDRLTSGLQPGQLWVVGARPGMGKTILAAQFARHCAFDARQPVLMFSLEMTATELTRRMIAAHQRVPLTRLTSGLLEDADWTQLARLAGAPDAPLYIDDTPGQTLAGIRSTARSVQRTHGLGLVIVDYLQLIESTGKRTENRQQEVALLSRGLKLLARELSVPVVVAAQLNRGVESRADKTPQMSDLRESGAVEQDADVVLLMHRPDYYDKTDRSGEIDVHVAKHRGGPTDVITAAAQLHFARIVDLAM